MRCRSRPILHSTMSNRARCYLGGIDTAQRLPDMVNPHRDAPPVQNAGDGSSTAARTRPGRADFLSLRTVTVPAGRQPCSRSALRNARQRRDHFLRRQSKASRRFPSDFNLANGDVDVSRLIAMSGSNVGSVDRHHYLGREIGVGSGLGDGAASRSAAARCVRLRMVA